MSYTYARRKNTEDPARDARAAGPGIAQLASGAQPTQAQMGSRVDLPGEIREKMETSFGADFSGVRLYESETVARAGAEAVTRGNSIAFAPGKLDLTSTAGQALLGHELSHVVSQSRGESTGQGFLNDPALEAQADRQGEMAARGESVYEGPVSPAGGSSTVSASGPMQAKKKKEPEVRPGTSSLAGSFRLGRSLAESVGMGLDSQNLFGLHAQGWTPTKTAEFASNYNQVGTRGGSDLGRSQGAEGNRAQDPTHTFDYLYRHTDADPIPWDNETTHNDIFTPYENEIASGKNSVQNLINMRNSPEMRQASIAAEIARIRRNAPNGQQH